MEEYLRRANSSLADFRMCVERLGGLTSTMATPPDGRKKLAGITDRLHTAAEKLARSLELIAGDTALDVVDLQVRMETESAALASALKALGDLVEKSPDLVQASGQLMFELEESGGHLAAALFPNAIEGVREINRTLWQFRPLWLQYATVLSDQVTRRSGKRLTSDEIADVERTANGVKACFDDVNELLNQLVVSNVGDGPTVQSLIRKARASLSTAVQEARARAADKYKPFRGVLDSAEDLARRIDDQFSRLRVPVFPAVDRLEALGGLIDSGRYAQLAGVERFALLNIGSRLKSIAHAAHPQRHLLSPEFGIRIFDVFPDRVYFTAEATFIEFVEALREARVFKPAPASLHRFNKGSFKQRATRKGSLQLSYAPGSVDDPTDHTKVRVDADIDLYRTPVRHLFGEVLVNHLTGRKTDQFKVFDILASHDVTPIGGFSVVTV